MSILYGFISMLVAVAIAYLTGFPIVSTIGLSFSYFEYFFLGFFSSLGYYYYFYRTKKHFTIMHVLKGFLFGFMSLFIIMFIQYEMMSKVFGGKVDFLYYLDIFKGEIIFFLIGSVIVVLTLIGNQVKCRDCRSGYFKEKLLFKVNNHYANDVKEFIRLADMKNYHELLSFIKERRVATAFSVKKKSENIANYSFYLLTCYNCKAQYIVSKRHRDVLGDSNSSSYQVITKLTQNTKIDL